MKNKNTHILNAMIFTSPLTSGSQIPANFTSPVASMHLSPFSSSARHHVSPRSQPASRSPCPSHGQSAATLIFPHLHPNTSPSYLMHFISISLLSMRIKSIKSLSEFFKSSIVGPMTRIVPKQFLCCDTTLSTWLVLSQGRRESRALWQAKNWHLFKQ